MAFKKKLSSHAIPGVKGIAALPTVLIIAGITLLMMLAILGSGILESLIAGAQKESSEAFFKAETGIKDALQRLARNPGFSSGGYNPIVGDTAVSVIVQKDTFSSPCTASSAAGKTCIIATGTVKGKTRKIEVVVNLNTCFGGTSNGNACTQADATTCANGGGVCQVSGKITQESWKELTE